MPVLVGPSTSSEHNTIRAGLIPVACWKVSDVRFQFGSSFVVPAIALEMRHLAVLVKKHPQCPLSVFGHADPVGNDDYNKALSGRRAIAIYAMLTRKVDLWEQLYSQPMGSDDWRTGALDVMIGATQSIPSGSASTPTMSRSSAAKSASARKNLFLACMESLCGPDLKLDVGDFLAAGADSDGKGDYQGCSEFNPLSIFSQQDEDRFRQIENEDERDARNSVNRRVVVLLFRRGTRVQPDLWPCPRAKEGVAGCRKRFWSDSEQRRGKHLPDQAREFSESEDTFACRFYQRLTNGSPCERKLGSFRVRLFDLLGSPVPSAPYMADEGAPPHGTAEADGTLVLSDLTVPSTCTISWSRPENFTGSVEPDATPTSDQFEFSMSVFIDVADSRVDANAAGLAPTLDARHQAAARRLHNLGFSMGDSLADNIRFFQREFGADETGLLDDVETVLKERHRISSPPSRYNGLGVGPVLPPSASPPSGPPASDPIPDQSTV